MEVLIEILKYTIPALIVFFTTYIFLKTWSRNEEKRRGHEKNLQLKDDLMPVRLQAYERIILFLERTSPESVLIRLNKKGMSAQQLQNELQNTLRHEYEHNITQQTYVSTEAWQRVQMARNQTLKIISDAASELKEGASGSTLGKLILEKVMEHKAPPSQVAIEFLKQEVRELYMQ